MELLIGIAALGFGLLTLAARVFGWSGLLSKQDAMIQRFGAKSGRTIHLIAYTVVPLTLGVLLLLTVLSNG